MAKYKLTYFDFPASRGEECRLALHAAGVPFEDQRIQFPQWADMKATTPYGALPLLETDGQAPLAQSNAILGYVGRTYSLHPTNAWEAARHEGIMQSVEDLRLGFGTTGSKDEDEKKAKREAFAAGPLQTWAGSMNAQIKGPFCGGDTLQVADIKVWSIVNSVLSGIYDHIPGSVLDDYAEVVALHAAVAAHPKIAEWRSK